MESLSKMIKEINLTKFNRYAFVFIDMNKGNSAHCMCYFESSLSPLYFETSFPCSSDVMVIPLRVIIQHSQMPYCLRHPSENIFGSVWCVFLQIGKGRVLPISKEMRISCTFLITAAPTKTCLFRLVMFQ